MSRYIFNTEGHLFPVTPEIAFSSERCTSLGNSCSDPYNERRIIMGDLFYDNESVHLKYAVGYPLFGALLNGTFSDTSLDEDKALGVPDVD